MNNAPPSDKMPPAVRWLNAFIRIICVLLLPTPFFLVFLSAATSAIRVYRAHMGVANWRETKGQLLSVRFEENHDPIVDYEFEANGARYRSSTFSVTRCNSDAHWARSYVRELKELTKLRGELPVYYHPDDPTRASCLYRSFDPAYTSGIWAAVSLALSLVFCVPAVLCFIMVVKGEGSRLGEPIFPQSRQKEPE